MALNKESWLPTDYKRPEPQGGNYMKFQDGPNKVRVLSAPLIGYMYWTKDNKPVRQAQPFDGVPADARLDDGKFKPKHFWAFVVWNYASGALQILEITQASIQGPIQDLALNADWGDPRDYDLTITKKGEGLDTEYSVQPAPHKAVPEDAHRAYRESRINLEALFEGKDPFNTASGSEGGEVKDVVQEGGVPFESHN
jgi:hypothetical protein